MYLQPPSWVISPYFPNSLAKDQSRPDAGFTGSRYSDGVTRLEQPEGSLLQPSRWGQAIVSEISSRNTLSYGTTLAVAWRTTSWEVDYG